MQAFSSFAKSKIRQDSDLSLIADLSKKANRKLHYLGLPSPWMGDVTVWKPYLDKVYAIEKEESYLSHLMDKAYTLEIFDQFMYFYGDVDAISKTLIDNSGRSISTIFPVDLINLDYCGGLDYQGFSKLATLESLILNQKKAIIDGQMQGAFPYFIIFLTHNIPINEGNPKAKMDYLKYLTRDLRLPLEKNLKEKAQKSLEWYLSTECPSAYQHKCFVMGTLFEYAQIRGFKVVPQKIIRYFGDKNAIMMHYQFKVIPINPSSLVPVDNKIDFMDIMDYPVIDENDNDIVSNFPTIRLQKKRE